jgi:hypothetical protein
MNVQCNRTPSSVSSISISSPCQITFAHLPTELISLIFRYLSKNQLLDVRLVNKKCKVCAENYYNLQLSLLLKQWQTPQKEPESMGTPLKKIEKERWIIKEGSIQLFIVKKPVKTVKLCRIFRLMKEQLLTTRDLVYDYNNIQSLNRLKEKVKEKAARRLVKEAQYYKNTPRLIPSRVRKTTDQLIKTIDTLIIQIEHSARYQTEQVFKENLKRLEGGAFQTLIDCGEGIVGDIWIDSNTGLIQGIQGHDRTLIRFEGYQKEKFINKNKDGTIRTTIYTPSSTVSKSPENFYIFKFTIKERKRAKWSPNAKKAFELLEKEQTERIQKATKQKFHSTKRLSRRRYM